MSTCRPNQAVKQAASAASGVQDAVEGAEHSVAELGDAFELASDKAKELEERGRRITEEMRKPLEVFDDRVRELNDLVRAGAISWETYRRAVAKADQQLREAALANDEFQSLRQIQVGAVTRQSTAGFSAIQAGRAATETSRRAEQQRRKQIEVLMRIEHDARRLVEAERDQEAIINKKVTL